MAVLNKMRDKAGIIFAGLAGAFLLMIVFEWGAQGDFFKSGRKGDEIGEVNGLKITSKEYDNALKQAREEKLNETKKKTLSDAEESAVRDEVWNNMVIAKLTQEKIAEYKISVTDQEVRDLMYYNPPEFIKRNFIDSATKQFKQAEYWAALKDARNDSGVSYYSSVIREELGRIKLLGFMQGLMRTTNDEMWDRYSNEMAKATAQVVKIMPTGNPDQYISQVTDAEIKKYYDDNSYLFKREAAKKLKFVMFREQPSPRDSAQMADRLVGLKKRLEAIPLTEKDSVIADMLVDYTEDPYQAPKALDPNQMRMFSNGSDLLGANVGDVVILRGTHQQQGAPPQFTIAKVYGIQDTGAKLFHIRHILIGLGKPENKDSARALATKIYGEIKGGGNFAQYAQKYSMDGSARNGGDLGWSGVAGFVPQFTMAVLKAPLNTVTEPVETQFGFHIIEVLATTQRKPIVAMVNVPLHASSQTTRMIEQQARVFREQASQKGFDQAAKDMNTRVISEAPPVSKKGQPLFGSFPFTNYILELKVGDITEPVKVNQVGATVVAQVVEDIPKGVVPMDDKIKDYIKKTLSRRKFVASAAAKAKQLRAMISPGESLEKLGSVDSNYKPKIITMGPAESVAGLGTEYAVNTAAFALKPGETSAPIKGESAYYIIQLMSIAPASKESFEMSKPMVYQKLDAEKKERFFKEWYAKLKDEAKISDYRSRTR